MLHASVIVPHYARSEALQQTLTALSEQTRSYDEFEVITVDDGSDEDPSDAIVDQHFPFRLKILRQNNSGPGAARNLGAHHAAGELLIFLDADMIPHRELVTAYAEAHSARPNALHIGRILPWPDAFQTLFDHVTRIESFHDLGPEPRQLVFYNLASGNFAVGAETFRRLGGFDETLRMTEDTDLGYRAQQAGIPLQYCPDAVGYHNHPKTLDQRCLAVERSAYWTACLLAKHPAMASLLPIYQDILPLRPTKESARLTARKLGRRTLALPPVYGGLRRTIALLERWWPNPRWLRSLYWKALSTHRVTGFHQGSLKNLVVDKGTFA